MKKLSKAQKAVILFHYWCGKLGVKKAIRDVRDNRMNVTMALCDWDTKNPYLAYHTRRIGQAPMCVIINVLFHEIGHLKNHLPYGTQLEEMKSEREAERFSLKMMKEHFSKDYFELCKRIKEKKLMKWYEKHEEIYFYAFLALQEYKEK